MMNIAGQGLVRLAAIVVVGALMITSVGAGAQSVSARETTQSVQRALERLPYYGVFDFMAFNVERGTVTLTGYAYHGSLKNAAESATRRVSGVDEIANRVELLPASQNDDRIRWATFYRIYTDAFLSRYAPGGPDQIRREIYDSRRFPGMHQPLGMYAIHIVVRNGHTTLFGVVDNTGDRQIAEMRAREVTGVFSVENEIEVAKKAVNTGE
ncbi:MAG TPA: BON domain-containing protein [Vicinamibacterales bacterium]|nr:BON domain-containing protein [Vicinamibacterales bacterium]